jgi:membrane protein implicated in regulation of membrane protease activity
LQFIFGDFSFNRDSFTFAVVSFITIFAIRKYFSKRSDQNVLKQDDVNLY